MQADSWLIHCSGLGKLAQKIARKFPKSTVVSVEHSMQQLRAQKSASAALGIDNIILCRSPLSAARVTRLLDTPHVFRYQVLPRSTLSYMLQQQQVPREFQHFFGSLLRLAATSFVEVPDARTFRAVLPIFTAGSASGVAGNAGNIDADPVSWLNPLLDEASGASARGKATPRDESSIDRSLRFVTALVNACANQVGVHVLITPVNDRLIRIDVSELKRPVLKRLGVSAELIARTTTVLASAAPRTSAATATATATASTTNDSDPARMTVQLSVRGDVSDVRVSNSHINVHTLMELGMINHYKRRAVLGLFGITGALNDMSPWNLLVLASNSTDAAEARHRADDGGDGGVEHAVGTAPLALAYVDLLSGSKQHSTLQATTGSLQQSVSSQLPQLLRKQLGSSERQFSFVEYNSFEGDVSLALSAMYSNSTFISLERNTDALRQHKHRAAPFMNNLICNQDSSIAFVKTLQSSPEFFQYQLYRGLIHKIYAMQSIDEFKKHLGRLLTLAQVSFFELPSASYVSLAHAMFYLEHELNGGELLGTDDDGDGATAYWSNDRPNRRVHVTFDADHHPHAQALAHGERKLIERLTDNSNIAKLDMLLLPSLDSGRSFLRVDSADFNRTVGHHFIREQDRQRDGHKRQYKLRNVGTTTNMIRTEDGSKIAYDTFGISLITLMRIGSSRFMRDRLYEQFIRLPLYLDMAPWNLQFRAGQLHYLDKDTMDVTYERLQPYAYQLILSMINFKRAMEDFGRCGSDAETKYGVCESCTHTHTHTHSLSLSLKN
jgi:hypothetical protein